MFAPLVRTLLAAVVMLLVVSVNAQASLLHIQYYFDSMPASETVGQDMTTDGLALVGTFELLAEESFGFCGSIVGCADRLVFSIAPVDGAGGDGGYAPGGAPLPVSLAQWSIGGNWELALFLLFTDPTTDGTRVGVELLPDLVGYSLGFCTPDPDAVGVGLCGVGSLGQPVEGLFVVSMPVHQPVPEPPAMAVFGLGLAGLGFFMARRRRVA